MSPLVDLAASILPRSVADCYEDNSPGFMAGAGLAKGNFSAGRGFIAQFAKWERESALADKI